LPDEDVVLGQIQGIPDNFTIDAAQARDLGVDAALAGVGRKTIHDYSSALVAGREKAMAEGRELDAQAFQLLITVASFAVSDDPKRPFTPMMKGAGWRSPLPDDLTDDHREALDVILAEISDPELRAHIADVLWHQKRRDPRHGRIAVESYLASARRLFDPDSWNFPHARLKRALRIAALFGGSSPELQSVVSELTDTINRLGGKDPLYFTEAVMSLMTYLDLPESDVKRYREIATSMAQTAVAQFDYRRARKYLAVALKWSNVLKDTERAKTLRLEIAESYVSEAAIQPSHMLKASTLRNGVRALREAGADKARIDAVRATLDESQELMLSELKPIGIPFDVTEIAEGAIAEAQGVEPIEGMWKLAVMLVPVPKKSEFRARAKKNIEEFSFTHALQRQHIGSGGRHTGTIPGAIGSDAATYDLVVEHEMLSETGQHRLLAVTGLIEPMRRELLRQFWYTEEDVFYAVQDRLFVPRGRELLWARGLHAGLVGDYTTALHILIPQIDNSLRHVLQLVGTIPYTQMSSGVQDVFRIEDTLNHPKLSAALGEDRVFLLKSVLTGRTSANMRNLMSHGLLDYGHSSSVDSAYVWWLALHLVATIGQVPPELAHLVKPAQPAQQNGPPSTPPAETNTAKGKLAVAKTFPVSGRECAT
jgi:hypothetical protein